MARTLFVRDVPDDVHAYLERQARERRCSKAAALVAVLREAERLGLSAVLHVEAREGSGQ